MEDSSSFAASAPLIQAKDLSLSYGPKVVLSAVCLRTGGGEICGFRGPNGSGKSTFLKACLGLVRPRSGSLTVLGLAPRGRAFRAALSRIGYVPQQNPPGALRVTVREAVAMGRCGMVAPGRPLGPADRRAVDEALEAAGLSDLAQAPVQELSGGQYQRTNLARALVREPDLLILDEPTTHLDAQGRDDVKDMLAAVAAGRKASMILVSHDEDLLRLCDRLFDFGGGAVKETASYSRAEGGPHA